MASLRITGAFLMGSLAGFGIALLTCVARLLSTRTLLEFSPINSFLAGVVLLTLGTFGCVAVARFGKTWRLRTTLGAIAIIAVLLGGVIEIRRRSSKFWGLYLMHQAQAVTLNARCQLTRFDPRVSNQEAVKISTLAAWHSRTALRFYQAANAPWLPLEPGPSEPK